MARVHLNTPWAAIRVAVLLEVGGPELDRLRLPSGWGRRGLAARSILRDDAGLAVLVRVLVLRPDAHSLHCVEAPALPGRHPLDGADLHHRLSLRVEDVVGGPGPMLAQPNALMPAGLEEDVVARAPGRLPAKTLAELQGLSTRLLAEEAGVGGPAVFAAEVLRHDG